jgi:hypothetical protein
MQENYPDLVAVDSFGNMTGNVADFCASFLSITTKGPVLMST